MAKRQITYTEELETLTWLDDLAERISEVRGGARVNRADVLRWATRKLRAEYAHNVSGLHPSTVAGISAQV